MADELKKAGATVVVHPTMQRAGASMETLHSFTGNAAALDAAGVPVTICTGFEGYVPKTRVLRHEVAMAVAAGMDRERALRAVTVNAARLLGIEKDYGSIEVGKGGENVARKGLAVRLDPGAGGVGRGRVWILHELDTLRAAADLGVPMVAVALAHRKGYFRQRLDPRGAQSEEPDVWAPEARLEPMPQRVVVTIEGRAVQVRGWRHRVRGVAGLSIRSRRG